MKRGSTQLEKVARGQERAEDLVQSRLEFCSAFYTVNVEIIQEMTKSSLWLKSLSQTHQALIRAKMTGCIRKGDKKIYYSLTFRLSA